MPRLRCETVDLTIGKTEKNPVGHKLKLSLAYDPETKLLREVVFVGRGKSGHGLDFLLHDLGIAVSRAIQGRNPDTGKKMDNN